MAAKGRTRLGVTPFLLKYKSFAIALNAMFCAKNVAATAEALKKFEQKSKKKYEFGNWAPTLGSKMNDEDWGGEDARASWVSSVADIPPVIRKQMGYLIRDNLYETPPTPIQFDVKLGPNHGIEVGSGEDMTTGILTACVNITIVCKN